MFSASVRPEVIGFTTTPVSAVLMKHYGEHGGSTSRSFTNGAGRRGHC